MIFVAGKTGWVEPFERLRQVVNHYVFAVRRRDVFGIMALFAFQPGVLTD